MYILKKIFTFFVYFFAIIGFLLVAGYFAIMWGFTNTNGIIDNQSLLGKAEMSVLSPSSLPESLKGEEWRVLKSAIQNDMFSINRAGKDAGINPRLIVALIVPEQLRLFHSERELFKQYFAPLKILGNQNQFSWGIMGIKKDTATLIEKHLRDPESPYYLGVKYEHLLDFETDNHDEERFKRITSDDDHYFNYLYSALFLKQIIKQWNSAGYDIGGRPEILATLYNIGFEHSYPKENPLVGGSKIDINDKSYSFGSLAADFYFSNELRDIFD